MITQKSPVFVEMQHPPLMDLIWGATAIAREINVTPRQAFYMLESGHLPARKVGARWCASRQALRRHFGEGGNADV